MTPERTRALEATARAWVANGKGILVADESNQTMTKRIEAVGAESTPEPRRRFRELLVTTPGVEGHISGVIMCDETIRRAASDGTPFPTLLASRGIHPGIKVDTGAKVLAEADGEMITEGLDGLRERLVEYHELGASFAKWRAVIGSATGFRAAPASPPTRMRSAVCRALPRGGDRADRGARGVDGRRPCDRALGGGNERRAAGVVRGAA